MTTFKATSPAVKGYKYTENAFLPKYVTVPLSQEKDCICNPLVKAGDIVTEGQVIARAENKTGRKFAKIHSPIPGTVTDIVSTVCPDGSVEQAIKIKLEGEFSYLGKPLKNKNWKDLAPETLITRIGDNGIINTFRCSEPVSLENQIREKVEKKEKYLVVRLFDEDIFRIADVLMTRFKFEEVKTGAMITAKAMDAEAVIFAVDSRFDLKKYNESTPENADESFKNKFYFVEMNSTRYPSAYEKEIKNAFNKVLKKSTGITLNIDALYTDPMTMYGVYRAIVQGVPAINQYVHFSGNCLNSSCFINVELGFSIREIINQIGGFLKQPTQIIINGMICGNSISSMDVPVTKYVKSVEVINKEKMTDNQVYSCVKCGECRYICPVKLSPDILYNYMVTNRPVSENHKLTSLLCRECGLCNTVCQARLPLSQTIAVLKNKILEEKNGRSEE